MDTQAASLITTGLVVVSVIFPLLSLASVLLRFKARSKTNAGLQADDWWMVATWVLCMALSINVWVYADLMGIDSCKVDALSCSVYAAVCLVVASCMVQVVLTTVKISVLLLYKRIFLTRPFAIAVWCAMVFVLLWGLSMILIVAIQGNPATFIRTTATGEVFVWRLDPTIVGYTQVGSSLILDVLILTFPLPIISTLHMPTKRKIMVGAIFSLGFFCCIASAVRLALNHKVLTSILTQAAAVSVQATQFCFLIVEPHCSIIAGCLPTFGPLIAGGRAPESIVRSVQSLFSIGSARSSPRGSKNRAAVRLPSQSESQQNVTGIEDQQGEFPLRSTTEVRIKRGSADKDRDGIEMYNFDNGIHVTKGVDVERT